MAGKTRHKLMLTIPQYAQSNADIFIAAYGIDRAEIIAKLTLEKIRASKRSLIRRYGKNEDIKCVRHPNYKAIRKPRCACQTCWDIWEMKHPNETNN